MDKLKNICQILEIHPLSGMAMITIDIMLFSAEICFSFFSIPGVLIVSFLAGIGVMLVQKGSCNDNWCSAAGKGLLLAVITAIPTPLPSIITGSMMFPSLMKLLATPFVKIPIEDKRD